MPLLALANGAARAEALLAKRALRNLAEPLELSTHPRHAQAMAMAPALLSNFKTDRHPEMHRLVDESARSWSTSISQSFALHRRMGADFDPEAWIGLLQVSDRMGREGRFAVTFGHEHSSRAAPMLSSYSDVASDPIRCGNTLKLDGVYAASI